MNATYFFFHFITLHSENDIFYPGFWFQKFSWLEPWIPCLKISETI